MRVTVEVRWKTLTFPVRLVDIETCDRVLEVPDVGKAICLQRTQLG